MPFFFNITGWGAEGPLPQTSLRLTADALSCALPRVPHFGSLNYTLKNCIDEAIENAMRESKEKGDCERGGEREKTFGGIVLSFKNHTPEAEAEGVGSSDKRQRR
jgi:hypothetical protein